MNHERIFYQGRSYWLFKKALEAFLGTKVVTYSVNYDVPIILAVKTADNRIINVALKGDNLFEVV